MRLSEKGLDKVYGLEFEDVEFDQEDFTGVVILTVEEAKGILWDLRDLYKQTYGYEWVKNEPWFAEFKWRIEQAEGKR